MSKRNWIIAAAALIVALLLVYFFTPVPTQIKDYAYQRLKDSQQEAWQAEREAMREEYRQTLRLEREAITDSLLIIAEQERRRTAYYRNLYEESKHQDIDLVYDRTIRDLNNFSIPE